MLLLATLAEAIERPDLTGSWRLVLDVATQADIPVLGTTRIRTVQVMLVDVAVSPAGLWARHDTCSLEAETQPSIATTSFPAAFVDAIPSKEYLVELTPSGSGWGVHMDLGSVALGYDPEVGGFPSALQAPGVIDWDHDGAPAATIQITVPLFGMVSVYRAQTSRAVLDGRVTPAGQVEGAVTVSELQQRTLGASSRLFIQNPEVRSDPANSRFTMQRVPKGSTCLSVAR